MDASLFTLLGAWGVVTALLIVALIYRSALSTHEDTQIFLDAAETSLAKEQQTLGTKLDRLGKWITALMIISGVLLVVAAALWIWQGLRTL
jgi:hypothetical protein